MIYLYGNVINLKKNDAIIDRKTGEFKSEPSFTVELLCQDRDANGEMTNEVLKVKIKELAKLEKYRQFVGKTVLLHVGKMEGSRARGEDGMMVRGRDIYFARPDTFPVLFTMPDFGAQPQPVRQAA